MANNRKALVRRTKAQLKSQQLLLFSFTFCLPPSPFIFLHFHFYYFQFSFSSLYPFLFHLLLLLSKCHFSACEKLSKSFVTGVKIHPHLSSQLSNDLSYQWITELKATIICFEFECIIITMVSKLFSRFT